MFDRQFKIATSQGPQTTPASIAGETRTSRSLCRPRVERNPAGARISRNASDSLQSLVTRILAEHNFRISDSVPTGPVSAGFSSLLGGAHYSETQNCSFFCLVLLFGNSACRW